MNSKLRQPVSLSITAEESKILERLKNRGVSNISIFRRGLLEYEQDYARELPQNNRA